MPVAIQSRLPWEALFVQPIAQQMDMGQVKGTLHLCQLIATHYDSVVKTGGANMPVPTGPTPPSPMVAGKAPLFQTSAFVGFKASEVLNLVTSPPMVLADKALALATKKYGDKVEKLKKKKDDLQPKIEKAKKLGEKIKGLKVVYDKSKALDFRGAIDAGAKEFESPLIPGFDKLKKRADKLTEPELKKEIEKKVDKEKQKVLKKLEPLKKKIEKIKKEVEDKINDIINRVLTKISMKIAQSQIKKGKLAADTGRAATMSYVSTIEANKAAVQAKILAAKAVAKKIMTLAKNIAKVIAFIAVVKKFAGKLKELSKNIPDLKDLLKPPSPPSPPNLLGFGKMNLDIMSENFELPEMPEVPDVTATVKELKEKGVEKIQKDPTLKKKTAKLKEKIDKKTQKIQQKMDKVMAKAEKIKKEIEDFKKNIQDKAKQWAINIVVKLIPPGGTDPTEKVKIINEKKKKIQELLEKIDKIKKEVEEKVVKVMKEIQKLQQRIAAVAVVAKLVKDGGLENYKKAIDEGAKQFESPLIPGFDKLQEKKDKLTEEELKKEISKKIDKVKKKLEPKLERIEKKLERTKKRIDEKMEPIKKRLDRYTAFAKAIAAPPASPEVTPSGKLMSAALSVGLIGYWTGGALAPMAPGGVVTFPGLPLNALTTLDGKNAEEEVAKIFNKDSELSNADKMRTLANIFEAHFKTITGMWQMPTPGGPVPTPWISYG